MPSDVDPVLGYWNTDRGEREYWEFQPDYTVRSGRKETDIGWKGTWLLKDDYLEIKILKDEFSTDNIQGYTILLNVIDHDNLILNFANGNMECLIRNNDIL
ncbi:MAG: hypothetical protein FWD78_05560 [Treponema sp.]|nr:hypothetical protein [Treponema sp.]